MTFWPQDTIARRFALTVMASILVAVCLAWGFAQVGGAWVRPTLENLRLLERADDIARIIESVPKQQRPSLTDAAGGETFRVDWYPVASTVTAMLDAAAELRTRDDLSGAPAGQPRRRAVEFNSSDRDPSLVTLFKTMGHPHAYFLALALHDGSWLVFTAPNRLWGVSHQARIAISLALVIVSVSVVSAIATHFLAAPIRQFTQAVRRFGTDPRAASVPEVGPRELRTSIAAFNAMQAQIQSFVEDRTTMLAAISHDLRTPLTKMRLRGELIEDQEQRARLFRDVDDMRAMVESALAFFRDDIGDEATTSFDFPELLRTIADDFSDHGCEVAYRGVPRLAFVGRPFALRRAFTNLVDNAAKYGRAPELELARRGDRIMVMVRDSGPGIPPEAAERVFAPFFRLEQSRNRATGGVGLGLTSARAVIRAHGGDITLSNQRAGGLEVRISLPELFKRSASM